MIMVNAMFAQYMKLVRRICELTPANIRPVGSSPAARLMLGVIAAAACLLIDGGADNGGHQQHAAFCLETQHYPDSPNQPEFPSSVLRPDEEFHQVTVYKFSVE